jgi:nitroreductase/NAD-dependent dihydropyrimidine dehydrogenase PreA subunit
MIKGVKMSTLTVDDIKCNRCGICALECPRRIIEMVEPEALPSWVDGGDEQCIDCGHCVAVCPLAAISLATMSPQDCTPVRKKLLPTAEQAEHLLRSRRSIRVYKPERVPREMLAKLIDIARYAPSAHNSQPLQWLVIQDSQEIKRLAGVVADWMRLIVKERPNVAKELDIDWMVASWDRGEDRITRSAPHLVVVHAPADDAMAPVDAPIALTYLELAAYFLGLGACWAGFVQAAATFYPPMTEALQLPQGHRSLGAMMVGYPKHRFARIPVRKEAVITWR